MANDAFITTKQGISQFERWFDALMPEYVEIDSRDTPDLLRFATELSSQINYYNQLNELDGTWNDFFTQDPYLLAQMVSRFNISDTIGAFNHYLEAINNEATQERRDECFADLFFFISNLGNRVLQLNNQFIQIGNSTRIEEIRTSLPDVEPELQQLFQFFNEAAAEIKPSFENRQKFPPFFENRVAENKKYYFKFKSNPNSKKENFTFSLKELVKIFDRVNAKFHQLVQTAQTYVLNNEFMDQQFPPQISLFLAFLDLYSHLRTKINGINRRHLDFYYKEQLGIELKEGEPDEVHLIIEPNLNAKNILITTNDSLIAEIAGKEPILYHLKSELLVSKIRIAEIKTIFKSNFVVLKANTQNTFDVKETPIYRASHPIFKPSQYLQNPAVYQPWAAFGEEQQARTGNLRTMEDANLALIIGSPLFYQLEGDREFELKIHFTPASYNSLVKYINNFHVLTGNDIETSIYHLLFDAFKITFTSTKCWEKVKNYSVKFDIINNKERVFEIKIQLNKTEAPFDLYKRNIHLQAFDSMLPLLRIELNNYAEHHPFSFFSNTLIEQITIKASVKGFQSVKLQNNIGMLSTANPFQVFGPQPNIGSFLDIKNTNVFNCFTKELSLHLEWMDLPRDKGGLATYYRGYGAPFANDSYLAGISTLNNGIYLPKLEKQQTVKLFTINEGNDYLSSKTHIEKIDFGKIKFLNVPTLEADNEPTFNEGVLRMELCSPPEAFGQRLFPKIFPEIVMNNAKMFGKKEPLPNQPLIPMVKGITVDYVLEYSENFIENKFQDNRTVELYHLHPFGYEQIYPGNYKKNIFFMPCIDDNKNLLIGLDNCDSRAELNLLFQLEDSGFYHTLFEPETIKWTYLSNNSWVDFPQRDQVFDSTKKFINSGIVKLCLPKEIPTGNSILNPNLFWIRASSEISNGINSRIIAIHNNGAIATREEASTVVEASNLCLKSGTIKDFKHTVKGIEQIWQPFQSFKGRLPECKDKYYVRISERIRHKQRPVQLNDICQIVLEEFPEILTVKCFNIATENFMVAPNINLQLVLVPKEQGNERLKNQQPRVTLSTLYSVKSFLLELISPFVTIEVGNPVYEKVKIICKVLFTKSAASNSSFYLSLLTKEINGFIAPWLYSETEEVKIGNYIYKSDILLFIKKRAYVEYVSGFSAVHFSKSKDTYSDELYAEISDTAVDTSDLIIGSSPASVFIPSSDHIITLLDEPEFEPVMASGIGRFVIGDELLVVSDIKEFKRDLVRDIEAEDDDDFFSLIITQNI